MSHLKEIRKQTVGYIVSALGLVAALAWNDSIKALIDSFYASEDDSLAARFTYAVIITIVVVLVSRYLLKVKGEDAEAN